MSHHVTSAFEISFNLWHWIALVLFAFFMAYYEGFKGFQKKYSPRVAARVRYLRDQPDTLRSLLAPLFCIGYFHANKKTLIKAYVLTIGIALLVRSMNYCPQPWRGIVDLGVMIGLSWGLIAFWIFAYKALTQKEFNYSPETP
ncbi:hypothetical protein JIN77_01480 [Verrucomicrobiaceae bacterium R5-34]|uniref:Uncharacterized protein n=2 Tax=Oceaniferula flava TaxID=2800421 RepID=A0AAE2SC78_9BACT|nr:hypothetical protein [Verrucomicrobiaceae bacterium R5-34]MBK1853611.1 hypothetical protein [Oceaniferula flavus]MBM1134916.1 hypothetical protein [Oceaniferula flavus]